MQAQREPGSAGLFRSGANECADRPILATTGPQRCPGLQPGDPGIDAV